MSIAGGLARAVDRIAALDGTALQIFSRNQRQWRIPPLTETQIAAFKDAVQKWGNHPIAVHDSYLTNLASARPAVRTRSRHAFAQELARVEQLGIAYLITHPGSPGLASSGLASSGLGSPGLGSSGLGSPGLAAPGSATPGSAAPGSATPGSAAPDPRENIHAKKPGPLATYVRNLDRALAASKTTRVRVLLENTAGQGAVLGATFEELAAIIAASRFADRLGVCIDTCHAFAAGYDLRSPEAYLDTMAQLERTVGLDRVGFFHLNDSVYPLGARKDRHTHIGEGQIGKSAFRFLLFDPRFRQVGKVIETPKGQDSALDRKNLNLLRSLRRPRSARFEHFLHTMR
jgi:deoxyribonuclease-4